MGDEIIDYRANEENMEGDFRSRKLRKRLATINDNLKELDAEDANLDKLAMK